MKKSFRQPVDGKGGGGGDQPKKSPGGKARPFRLEKEMNIISGEGGDRGGGGTLGSSSLVKRRRTWRFLYNLGRRKKKN